MSTVVYQKIQPCYDSNNFIESRRLSLKLKPETELKNEYSNMFGWSGGIDAPSKIQPEYIHPLVKKSTSKLSQRSLEMCTESLGCETGTCIIENNIFLESKTTTTEAIIPRQKPFTKKQINTQVINNLPPPLTTLTGPNAVQFRPVREDGRLVIEAVPTPAKRSCLQAERSNGRLTLSLISDNVYSDDYKTTTTDDKNHDNENDNENNNEEGQCTEIVTVNNEGEENLGENNNTTKDVNKIIVGVVKVQLQIPSRCMERGQGNKRLIDWEPFWVAT